MPAPMPASLIRDESGATAATFAIALFALVGIAGVGFDYTRLAAMDSELQNGADQAALAAATQLDGKAGACMRAGAAAVGLVSNLTLLANDGNGPAVTIQVETACDAVGSIRFYRNKEKTLAARNDGEARFVLVTVDARVAEYAFTPVIDVLNSGDIEAAAFAGLGSAICKIPPVMMCNPNEATDPNFSSIDYTGRGIRLIANDGGSNYGAGNFGYLENIGGANGVPGIRDALGLNAPPGDCVAADGVTTKPGVQVTVLNALNTRFDIYDSSLNSTCTNNGTLCPPATNVRKDVMRGNGASCAFQPGNGNNGWKLPANPYLPTSATVPLTAAQAGALSPMGYPRDMCHAVSNTGSCSRGQIGSGIWDVMAYFRSNTASYPTVPTSGELMSWFGTETPTRYQVYQFETANAATRLASQTIGGRTAYGRPFCVTPGIAPSPTVPDRRLLSVAVVNCAAEGVGGRTPDVTVTKWIDVFLVEPSLPRARTEMSDVYVEFVRETALGGGGGTTGNTVRRDVPYLIE